MTCPNHTGNALTFAGSTFDWKNQTVTDHYYCALCKYATTQKRKI
jgi:hypothetical protein